MSSSTDKQDYPPRRMTECDVILYTLEIPEDLKAEIADESKIMKMDISSYICGVLAGDIKRPNRKARTKNSQEES